MTATSSVRMVASYAGTLRRVLDDRSGARTGAMGRGYRLHLEVRGPWLLALILVLATAGVAAALVTSEESGTGAENVGDDGQAEIAAPKTCEATDSNPGGTNNYIEDAPERESLGEGFVIEGFVRESQGCERLDDVRVQVWLATETGESATIARRCARMPRAATGSRRRRPSRSSASPTSTSPSMVTSASSRCSSAASSTWTTSERS